MNIDRYGNTTLTEEEIFKCLYSGQLKTVKDIYTEDPYIANQFNNAIIQNADSLPKLRVYEETKISIEQFDTNLQDDWFMPEGYKSTSFDIVKHLLTLCKTKTETNRVLEELELFAQHNMIELLCYLKYLIDTMRKNNIVWGVGRGSSVASYCLYLLGVHKIDSIKYELDIREFLK
jgi:DNA polymerase III alpha subunit